jgi:hypothetical protein
VDSTELNWARNIEEGMEENKGAVKFILDSVSIQVGEVALPHSFLYTRSTAFANARPDKRAAWLTIVHAGVDVAKFAWAAWAASSSSSGTSA